jgi:hypothetical protein
VPAKQLKQRFQRTLREAPAKKLQAPEARRYADMLAATARRLTLDAAAERTPAQRLLLSLLELDAGNKQDCVTQLIESEQSETPSFEEGLKAERQRGSGPRHSP